MRSSIRSPCMYTGLVNLAIETVVKFSYYYVYSSAHSNATIEITKIK